MRIILTKDVHQNGEVKSTVRLRRGQATGWYKGTELEVSEATGEKLIADGSAIKVEAKKGE